jgi:hypothetical protein
MPTADAGALVVQRRRALAPPRPPGVRQVDRIWLATKTGSFLRHPHPADTVAVAT